MQLQRVNTLYNYIIYDKQTANTNDCDEMYDILQARINDLKQRLKLTSKLNLTDDNIKRTNGEETSLYKVCYLQIIS